MILYLLAALMVFVLYYFSERYFTKRALLKAGRTLAESFLMKGNFDVMAISKMRKNIAVYSYQPEQSAFVSVTNEKENVPFSALDYKNLVRFNQLMEQVKMKKSDGYEFFSHKKFMHLIYPFKGSKGSVHLLLLQTDDRVVDDFFNRNR